MKLDWIQLHSPKTPVGSQPIQVTSLPEDAERGLRGVQLSTDWVHSRLPSRSLFPPWPPKAVPECAQALWSKQHSKDFGAVGSKSEDGGNALNCVWGRYPRKAPCSWVSGHYLSAPGPDPWDPTTAWCSECAPSNLQRATPADLSSSFLPIAWSDN